MPFSREQYNLLRRLCKVLGRDVQVLGPKFLEFRRGVEKGLWEIILSYYPELEPYTTALTDQINEEMDFHMEMVTECCFDVLCGLEEEERYLVVFRQQQTDFEAEMAEARAEMHRYGTQAEAFVEDMRKTLNHQIASENFAYLCQQKVKQEAYEAFPEIYYFTSTSLRVLEYNINLHISEFNVGFQYITLGYRHNRFGDGGTVRAEDMVVEEGS